MPANDLDPSRFTGSGALSRGAELLKGFRLAEAWAIAVTQLRQYQGLGDRWMPVLATLEDLGGGQRVQFVNIDDPSQEQWITLQGPEFDEFKGYLDSQLATLKKAYEFEGGTFTPKVDEASGDAIDGINAMFVVQRIINHFSSKGDDPAKGIANSSLAMALRIQSWLTLSQLANQSLGDVLKVMELVRTLIRSEGAAQSSLSTLSRALGRTSEGLGLILGAANVVFDAYELSQAENEIQKAVYGTQLAFDSASFLAAAGSAGAGFIGASSVAAVLGGVGVLLAGLGIGVGALVEAFGEVAAHAELVGKYFGDADHAYNAGGYENVTVKDQKVLKPLVGAVVKEIDANGHVQFDSQCIYRTHHGSTGSGRENYFFWLGDFPKMVVDKGQAINVREGIGAPATGKLPNTTDYVALILPCTPKSYISYEWQMLPGATTRHDYGFDVIRRLEKDERFDYDFYIFPSEYIINKISWEYVATTVTVKLNDRSVLLQTPKFDDSLHGYMHYALEGANGEYVISLEPGVSFTLSSSSGTRWVLDPLDLKSHTATVKGNTVTIGGVQITVADHNFTAVLIIGDNSELLRVNFDDGTTEPAEEDASKYPGGSKELLAHLDDLNAKHQLHGSFVVVENYTTASGTSVGRAFYDVTKKRLLYTSDAPASLTKDAELVGYTKKDEVYFCNLAAGVIWRVDPASGTCLAKYEGYYPSTNRTLVRVWQEDNYVHALYRHQLGGDLTGELGYILEADSMRLVSVAGGPTVLSLLSQMPKWNDSLEALLQDFVSEASSLDSLVSSLPGKNIKATIESSKGMISVYGQIPNGDAYRYWISLHDRVITKSPPMPPPDIVFAGTVPSPLGYDVECCFYSLSAQRIMLQQGRSIDVKESDLKLVSVPDIFGPLSNVICVNSEIFVITKAGYILRMTQKGTLFLEAVNEAWFKEYPKRATGPWWTMLKEFVGSLGATAISILGVHDAQFPGPPTHPVVPTWLYNGKLVMGSIRFYGKQVGVAGIAKDGREAWLFEMEKENRGRLFSQPLLEDNVLGQTFSLPNPSDMAAIIPDAEPALKGYPFKSVVMVDNGLQYTTTDGVVLIIKDKTNITLYGVDATWQRDHFMNMERDLAQLAKQWQHGEVIIMLELSPAWYLISAGKLLAVKDAFGWQDNPHWLGVDLSPDPIMGYVYLPARGLVYGIAVDGPLQQPPASAVVRFDDLFVMVSGPEASGPVVLPLQSVRYAMVGQSWELEQQGGIGPQDLVCIVSEGSWAHYHENVVQWRGPGRIGVDASDVGDGNLGSLVAKKVGDDLSIVDTRNGHAITVRKAYLGEDTSYAQTTIMFGKINVEFSVRAVQDAQRQLQESRRLDHLPDVPLSDIAGHA